MAASRARSDARPCAGNSSEPRRPLGATTTVRAPDAPRPRFYALRNPMVLRGTPTRAPDLALHAFDPLMASQPTTPAPPRDPGSEPDPKAPPAKDPHDPDEALEQDPPSREPVRRDPPAEPPPTPGHTPPELDDPPPLG